MSDDKENAETGEHVAPDAVELPEAPFVVPEEEPVAKPPEPERKVKVNDSPEVFETVPDSTDVKRVEPPPKEPKPAEPCPPAVDKQQLDKIISDTLEAIAKTQQISYDQKLASQKLAFMLTCIKDSLSVYSNHVCKLNGFLVNNERLQSCWFCKTRNALKCYGDYTLVIKDDPEEQVKVCEVDTLIPSNDLKALVDNVVNGLHAGGMSAMAMRTICKSINDKIDYRTEFIEDQNQPFESWFVLLNKAADSQDVIMDMLFKVSANISFLKTGEISEALVLDLGKELDRLEKNKTSNQQLGPGSKPTQGATTAGVDQASSKQC